MRRRPVRPERALSAGMAALLMGIERKVNGLARSHVTEGWPSRLPLGYVGPMTTRTKRLLIGLSVVVLLPPALLAAFVVHALSGGKPIPDGFEISPTARLVADGIVDMAIIDLGNGS